MPGLSRLFQLLFVEHLPITLVVVLGAAAVYLLLPRPRAYPVLWGAAAGAAALLVGGGWLVRAGAFTPEALLFYLFSALAVVAGVFLITQQNPARAALAFALVVLSSCGLFLLLAAPFLMAATTIVYAGAIVVIFLFVIMLAQQEGLSSADQRSREPLLASLAGFLLLGALLYALGVSYQDRGLEKHLGGRLQETEAQLRAVERFRRTEPSAEQAQEAAGHLQDFLERFKRGDENSPDQETEGAPPALKLGGTDLDNAIDGALTTLAEQQFNLSAGIAARWGDIESELAHVLRVGSTVLNRQGMFQPPEGLAMSGLSGPPPNQELRRDAQGRPELPAENVAYLGRSLFTDYLLAVELAGTLLLVATIGAIAIAQRRTEGPS
jgi:NADH:ubiquinone oxidoreductase subunit 6 (subunit J)